MNERQLESFILACEKGSFTKAAEASFISTPAFAQQIALLERSLGFRLFDRGPRGVAPTEAGLAFLGPARQIMDIYRHGVAEGLACERRRERTLRIGCDPVEVAPFLAEICSLVRRSDPDVALEFVDAAYAEQLEALARGAFDACFFADNLRIEPLGLRFTPLYEDAFCCCVPADDPLADQDSVAPEELVGRRVYIEGIYRDELRTHEMLSHLSDEGIALDIDGTPFDRSLPMSIVVGGGALLVPRRYVCDCVPPLVAVPLDWPASRYGIVSRAGAPPALDTLVASAREYFAG